MSEGNNDRLRDEIVRENVRPAEAEPNYLVLETIAEAEGIAVTDLPPMYERIDHIIDKIFEEPPVDAAQVEVSFSYHGYRITIDQEATVTLRKLGTLPDAVE